MRFGLDDFACIIMCLTNIMIGILELSDDNVDLYGSYTCMVCGIVCLIPSLLKQFGLVRLNLIFIITIVVALTMHSLGVLMSGYDVLEDYDMVTHTLSSILVSMCVWMTLCCYNVYNSSSEFSGRSMMITIMLVMATFSVYWEVFEYLLDTATNTHSQYSPFDTAKDTMFNMLGSFITILYSGFKLRRMTMKELVDSFELSPRLIHFIDRRHRLF